LIRRVKVNLAKRAFQYLQSINQGGSGWRPWWSGAILESYAGAWQQNVVVAPTTTLLSFSPVFACVTGIASDIAKVRLMLSRDEDGIWSEIREAHGNSEESELLPLLKNPNHYQDHIKFFESWVLSKLLYGNTYVLKQRESGRVTALYILHPNCVKPLVDENGEIYYGLQRDDLSGLNEDRLEALNDRYGQIAIPAREIIHDRYNCLWHPLIGVSPLYASGASATMGNTIQTNSTNFFNNKSQPGGMLSAPGEISDETASRLKTQFETNFSGTNIGKLFVAGDGLEFKQFSIDAQHAQQVEQLGWTVQDVARAFRYPLWKLGGPTPPYTKPDQAQTMYYTDCLQGYVTAIEECLDNGLELSGGLHTEFDLDELLRMDTDALYESNNKAKGWMKLDEQRFRANLPPLKVGGDTVYMQHQDYSVEAIAKRDAKDDPFAGATTPQPEMPTPNPMPEPPRSIEPDYDLDEFGARELRELINA
jgi:HK97 family phage portal protein